MTTTVTVLGASGQIARHAIDLMSTDPDVQLTLLARHRSRLGEVPDTARVIEGDVTDDDVLREAITGADVVYANLAGDVDEQAEHIVRVMQETGVDRLVFVTALGIYDEVPGEFGEWNRQQIGTILRTYRAAADVVTGSGLDTTNIRPAWLEDTEEIDYETTGRDEAFRGTVVSRRSVAALVHAIVQDPTLHSRADVGVNKPGTDGATPQFS